MSCPICCEKYGRIHAVREMMFGKNEEFEYFECNNCGCLSLQKVPQDLGPYYGNSYYSFDEAPISSIRRICYRFCLSSFAPRLDWLPFPLMMLMPRLQLSRNTKLLDIGCGSGSLIWFLRQLGYKAEGIDPFISADIVDEFGPRVRKTSLNDVHETYDILLFMHSLEHMPLDALASAREIISSDGLCVIRIPIINWAWQHYKTNWVQIDAPRHMFLHSVRSFRILAEKSGFIVEDVLYDSNDLQFWGSEAYAAGCSLNSTTPPQLLKREKMRILAMFLNYKRLGDQAQFYLRPR